MIIYDDKTNDAIMSGNQLLIPNCCTAEDVVFKASFIISADLKCKGKVTALFDLIVFGDVSADEIDVKGRFICMGRCIVSGTIIVQNDIWCEDIQANSITCHDRIVAQSIDASTVFADGSIIIGKTLAIEDRAQTNQNILCGETAYGAGKIIASSVLTVEPLDLDEGEESIESPFQYTPKFMPADSEIVNESARFIKDNNYTSYISSLIKNSKPSTLKHMKKYLSVLKTAELAASTSFSELRDASLLIWLIRISNNDSFKGWNIIKEWTDSVLQHFKNIAEGKTPSPTTIKPTDSLLKGSTVSHTKFGTGIVEDIVFSGPGVNAKKMAIVNFYDYGVKYFPIPDALKFFTIQNGSTTLLGEENQSTIICEIGDYEEWLSALETINEYKDYLGSALHTIIFTLLIENLGLKAKFVKDRFEEKGWN